MADKFSCTLLTDCLFLQKSRPTCHNQPIGDLSPPSVGWLTAQESEKYSSQISHLVLLHLFVCININSKKKKRRSFTANLKKTVFSSPWKTTRPPVTSWTCEKFCPFSSRKGNSAQNPDSTCSGVKTNRAVLRFQTRSRV